MIAQFILSALLLVMLAYGLVAARRTRLLGPVIGLAVLTGFYFVWQPQRATELAELVGIGRGADLIFYLWIVLSMLVAINLHVRVRTQSELTTQLARAVALLEARKAESAGAEGSDDAHL